MLNTPNNTEGSCMPEMQQYNGFKHCYASDLPLDLPLEHYAKQLPSKNVYYDGDSINIGGHRYVIAQTVTGYTLLDAAAPGWMPSDLD
jgi:hypothetical protein